MELCFARKMSDCRDGYFFAWFEVAEPQVIRDSPEHEDINKASLEMRNFIGRDPYGRETLLNIYKAMQEKI